MSVGSDANIFDVIPAHAKKLNIQNPIISNEDLDKIKFIEHDDFKSKSVNALYKASEGNNGLERALEDLLKQVKKEVEGNKHDNLHNASQKEEELLINEDLKKPRPKMMTFTPKQ